MNRMERNTLRDLVWHAIDRACDGDTVSRSGATTNVLAALGLDDLDAAVRRGSSALYSTEARNAGSTHDFARRVLEAALTATEPCGRVLIGQGTDTWDPNCVLPSGHAGPCQPGTKGTDLD